MITPEPVGFCIGQMLLRHDCGAFWLEGRSIEAIQLHLFSQQG
ncbi:MAG: hypothetical protein ACI95X_001249 [Paraglaciecola sp.]